MTTPGDDPKVAQVVVPVVEIERMAVGGDGVGHLDDGRVVFVRGTSPEDRVAIDLTEDKSRFAKAKVVAVVEAGPHRVEPGCGAVEAGCGGCDWQHIATSSRAALQVELVSEVLARQAGVNIEPIHGGSVPSSGYRSTVRCSVVGGRAGFKRHRTDEIVVHGSCEVAVAELSWLFDVDWGNAAEVVLRAGVATGDLLAVVGPQVDSAGGDSATDMARVVGRDELSKGRRAWFFEEAAGKRWRVSADSFFQSGPWAVELLVDAVARGLGDSLTSAESIVDLYGGIGVFAGALAPRTSATWTVVESSPSAVADAKINLADVLADGGSIVRSKVERWKATRHDVVIADPPRSGLGAKGCDVIARSGAKKLALVSCDVASMGRDVGRLQADGWRLEAVEVLDLFPQTSHVETISTLMRPQVG